MDTTRFRDDLSRIAEQYGRLAEAFDRPDTGADLVGSAAPARILLLGMGSSRYAAGRVARAARAGGASVAHDWASAVDLPAPATDLLVIAVSATGSSREVLAATERYAGTGRLVAVTNTVDSPLARLADATSPLHADLEVSGVACRTYRHTIVVLERLLGLTEPHHAVDELSRAAAATLALSASASAWLPELSAVLDSPDGTHLLAPAERFCSAQQSTLMLRELPRRLAVACETGDWAHVDVYTTRTHDYRAAILTGSPWDAQAVEWLQSRSARYAAIGGALPGAELELRFDGDEDDRVRVLVETLPFELLADQWLTDDPEFSFSRRPADRTAPSAP
jgi:fructoselysine-6-P-deglycase FrlB-like protein